MAKPTIQGLQEALHDANGRAQTYREKATALEGENTLLKNQLTESRGHFADLKTRLLAAETANQYMRGYLARVQEDDVVREDLMTVGDPDGEQHMVPKRKPTAFPRPSDFGEPPGNEPSLYSENYDTYGNRRQRKTPKHWISY